MSKPSLPRATSASNSSHRTERTQRGRPPKPNSSEEAFFKAVSAVFERIIQSETDSLTRSEIDDTVKKHFKLHGSPTNLAVEHVKRCLSTLSKVRRVQRSGALEFVRIQGAQKRITQSNKLAIVSYYQRHVTRHNHTFSLEKETELYRPLGEWLNATQSLNASFSTLVSLENRKMKGAWSSPDLIGTFMPCAPAAVIRDQSDHSIALPDSVAIEVKPKTPTIRDVAQTSSYLRFANYSYLAWFEQDLSFESFKQYFDTLINNEVFQKSILLGVGLIVGVIAPNKTALTDIAWELLVPARYTPTPRHSYSHVSNLIAKGKNVLTQNVH